eukprot:1954815-Amphidinium_carterae.2
MRTMRTKSMKKNMKEPLNRIYEDEVYEEEHEGTLKPDEDEYVLIDADDYFVEQVDANAASKRKGNHPNGATSGLEISMRTMRVGSSDGEPEQNSWSSIKCSNSRNSRNTVGYWRMASIIRLCGPNLSLTPSVLPSPETAAEGMGASAEVEALTTVRETESHGSDLFASAESELSWLIPPVPDSHPEAPNRTRHRRLRDNTQSEAVDGESNYEHMTSLSRDARSDSDDPDGVAKLTIFADRRGVEFAMWSWKRYRTCRSSDYPAAS